MADGPLRQAKGRVSQTMRLEGWLLCPGRAERSGALRPPHRIGSQPTRQGKSRQRILARGQVGLAVMRRDCLGRRGGYLSSDAGCQRFLHRIEVKRRGAANPVLVRLSQGPRRPNPHKARLKSHAKASCGTRKEALQAPQITSLRLKSHACQRRLLRQCTSWRAMNQPPSMMPISASTLSAARMRFVKVLKLASEPQRWMRVWSGVGISRAWLCT